MASALREKVTGGTATPAEHREFHERQAGVIDTILTMPVGELFMIKEVRPANPEQAKVFTSVPCAKCGEMVAGHRARVRDGKFVCMPCAGEYGRGW